MENLLNFDLSKKKNIQSLTVYELQALEAELERLIKVNSECTEHDIDILMRLETEIMTIIYKLETNLKYIDSLGKLENVIEFKRKI